MGTGSEPFGRVRHRLLCPVERHQEFGQGKIVRSLSRTILSDSRATVQAVWITAIAPYAVLFILLIRGVTLSGSSIGIQYYLEPKMALLKNFSARDELFDPFR